MNKIAIIVVGIFLVSLVSAITINQGLVVNIIPSGTNLTILSPQNNAVFGNRQVLLNLVLGERVRDMKFSDNGRNFRTLCRNCQTYNQRKPFGEGFHEVAFKVTNNLGEEIIDYVNFTVDSKKPRIIRTAPLRGFTRGMFSMEFQEANPANSFLTYGNLQTGFRAQEVNLEECFEQRRNMRCEINVSLEDFDGQEITYQFNLTDVLNRTDSSRERRLKVDTSPPVVNSFDYEVGNRRVTFFFNITEINFDETNYIDFKERTPRERRLCSRVLNNLCERRVSFSRGEHNLTIRAFDEAGNNALAVENLLFSF